MRVGNWCNDQNASKTEFYAENPQEKIIPVQKEKGNEIILTINPNIKPMEAPKYIEYIKEHLIENGLATFKPISQSHLESKPKISIKQYRELRQIITTNSEKRLQTVLSCQKLEMETKRSF